MDEGRIHTLLSNRTGPVTRDVLADKADAIAKVFGEAGVMVTIVERLAEEQVAEEDLRVADDASGDPAEEPAPDYEYGGPHPPGEHAPWEEPYRADGQEPEDEPIPDDDDRAAPSGPALPDDLTHRDFPHAVDLRLSSTRWVPSPHGDDDEAAQDPAYDLGHDPGYDPSYDDEDRGVDLDLGPLHDDLAEEPPPRGGGLDHDQDEGRGPAEPVGLFPAGEQDAPHYDDFAPEEFEAEDFGGEDFGLPRRDDDADRYQEGVWLAPERSSPFGELGAAPGERTRLRSYLVWALVVSIVALVVLQLVFATRGPGAVGSTYEDGLAPYRAGEFAVARKVWEGAAAHGDPRAQYMLGYLVQNGLGQPWSNRRAAEWYRLAAAQGLPEAQTALARLYLEGLGVEPDAATGLGLLRRAADAGYAPALYQYAELLFHGRWVPQDYAAALEAFQAAAAGGSVEAADFVGLARYLAAELAPQGSEGELASD